MSGGVDCANRKAKRARDPRVEADQKLILPSTRAIAKAVKKASKKIDQQIQLGSPAAQSDIALDAAERGLSIFDSERRLVVCNQIFREMYALPKGLTRRGTHFSDILRTCLQRGAEGDKGQDHKSQHMWIETRMTERMRREAFTHTQELRCGRVLLVTVQPLPDGGWVNLHEDITERRRAEQSLSRLVRYDYLTDSANRLLFRRELEHVLKQRPQIALHWIDIDHLRKINDTLGHAAGDLLLKSIAKRLRRTVRKQDIVERAGGDEFAVVQVGCSGASEAELLAKRVLQALSKPHIILGRKVSVGASLGTALAPEHSSDADELIEMAKHALYNVRASGRDAAVFRGFGQQQGGHKTRRSRAQLRAALERGELELHYQPIIDSGRLAVSGCEALMRWQHPRRGMIAPVEFIATAEETGQIVQMGEWAIREACRAAAGWSGNIKVMVNLSSAQFENGELPSIVASALRTSGLSPERLELEITESVLLRDEQQTHEILHEMRKLGVSIVLDDFGTAYASLSYLRSFPFDKVKIDRSFIKDLDGAHRKECVAIINAITAMSKQMEMSVVAEGIETLDHLNTALLAGCDQIQGFYFSKPVSGGQIEHALDACHQRLRSAWPGKRNGKRSAA